MVSLRLFELPLLVPYFLKKCSFPTVQLVNKHGKGSEHDGFILLRNEKKKQDKINKKRIML